MTVHVAVFAMIAVPEFAQAAGKVPAPLAGVGLPALVLTAIGYVAYQRLKWRD